MLFDAGSGAVWRLGHEENAVAVFGGEEAPHVFLRAPIVVFASVVEETDTELDGAFHHLFGFFRVFREAQMVAT